MQRKCITHRSRLDTTACASKFLAGGREEAGGQAGVRGKGHSLSIESNRSSQPSPLTSAMVTPLLQENAEPALLGDGSSSGSEKEHVG